MKRKSEPKQTLSEYQDMLKTTLKRCIQVFDKYGIKWWLTDGSLLGAVRENDIISWDDDIDIGIDNDSYAMLWAKRHEIRDKYGLNLNSSWVSTLFPILKISLDGLSSTNNTLPIIDCLVYKYDRDSNKTKPVALSETILFPNYLYTGPVKGTHPCRFGQIIAKCPNNKSILANAYGQNYMVPRNGHLRTTTGPYQFPDNPRTIIFLACSQCVYVVFLH